MPPAKKRPRTAFIPADMFEGLDITDGARALFVELCGYAKENGYCWPAQATLANRLNVTRRTVQNRVRELETLGLVECLKGKRRQLEFRVNRERASLPAIAARNSSTMQSRRDQFGIHGRRGAAVRNQAHSHSGMKPDTSTGEDQRPNSVNATSPKQGEEQIQSSSAVAYRLNSRSGSSRRNSADTNEQIDWNSWANWLGNKLSWGIEHTYREIFRLLDQVKRECNVSTTEAERTLDRILKTVRRSFPDNPSIDELIDREKDRIENAAKRIPCPDDET